VGAEVLPAARNKKADPGIQRRPSCRRKEIRVVYSLSVKCNPYASGRRKKKKVITDCSAVVLLANHQDGREMAGVIFYTV
jgi:ribosomal protein S27AE